MSPVHRNYPRSEGRSAVDERCAGAPAPFWAACALVLSLAACGADGQAASVSRAAAPFPGSAPSIEVLGQRVLDALVSGDVETLEGFRLTEAEHNQEVWPELPASAPEVNFPVDFAWSNIQTRDRAALLRILPRYAEREVTYEGTECRGETEAFETFELLTDCWVSFHTPDGVAFEARVFKDVLERAGGMKIFRYYEHDPERLPGHATQ